MFCGEPVEFPAVQPDPGWRDFGPAGDGADCLGLADTGTVYRATGCRSCTVVKLCIAESGSELVQLNEVKFGMPRTGGVAEGA